MVAPHTHVGDVGHLGARLLRQLRDRPVVIQAGHRVEALARDVGRVGLCDQRVRVGRVADHEDAHVVGRAGVERLALRLEDAAVGLQQVGALHALRARPRADQQRHVHPVERGLLIVGDVDPRQQRERAVVELHRRALGRLHRVRDLQQREVNLRVGAEHLTARDPEQDRVADRAGRARNSDLGGPISSSPRSGGVAASSLSPASSCGSGACGPSSLRSGDRRLVIGPVR